MDQHIMNGDGLSFLDSRLGVEMADGSFVFSDECLETLMEICDGLRDEDTSTRPMRRRLAFLDIINKGLLPILLHLDDNREDVDTEAIFHQAVQVFSLLSQPIQCLSPKSGFTPRDVEKDMSGLLLSTKQAFTRPDLTAAILARLGEITHGIDTPGVYLSETDCRTVDLAIYLYRNVLYTQDAETSESAVNMKIIRILLESGFKDLVMRLLRSDQRDFWCVSLVQLLSLILRDNNYTQLTKETGGQGPMNRDSRSGSSVAISSRETTSGDEQGGGKGGAAYSGDEQGGGKAASPGAVEGKEKSDDGNEKDAMICYTSEETSSDGKKCDGETGDDMSEHLRELLSEFVLAFIKEGWGKMIKCIRSVMVNQKQNRYQLEGHYFMWLVQYFLRTAQIKEVPFEYVRSCLSVDVISLLFSFCVMSCEDVMRDADTPAARERLQAAVRKNYLTVVSLLEFLRAMNFYHAANLGQEDREYLCGVQNSVVQLSDMRYLFILLLRHYTPELYSKQYLSDVIVANHEFLLAADLVMSWDSKYNYFDLHEHVCLFATQDIMLKYNSVLEDFQTNSTGVNNCAFTMLHHVAGDCQCPDVLLQIPIVQNFLNILETPLVHSLPQECTDLMEYILQQCLGKLETDSLDCIRLLCGLDFDVAGMKDDEEGGSADWSQEKGPTDWSQEEEDELLVLFSRYSDLEPVDVRVSDIAFEMQSLGINKSAEDVERLLRQKYPSRVHGNGSVLEDEKEAEHSLDTCIKHIHEAGNERWIHWVQRFLIEMGHVKSGTWTRPADPVSLHYTALGKSIPLVVYTDWQSAAAKDEYFIQMLSHLGFRVPEKTRDTVFPSMPGCHTPAELYAMARLVGPVVMGSDTTPHNQAMEYTEEDTQGLTRDDLEEEMATERERILPNSLWPLVIQRTNQGNNLHV